jgi:AraC family transcriptional regulator of adaptative response/methylated-DNA-[protein]-cysteine methyltransferase
VYDRIKRAIDQLYAEAPAQPPLAALAATAGLSPAHFQRVFKAHAGVSPKRFGQALALEHAKRALADGASVLDAALAAGLSGPSRLHDLCLAAEAATPGSLKAKGAGLALTVGRHTSPFGEVAVAVGARGLAWLGFLEEAETPEAAVARDFPLARLGRDDAATAHAAARAFAWWRGDGGPLTLELHGTTFQLQVWRALVGLPVGSTTTYGDLARTLDAPTASRAVAGAVAANRVSVVIPCHRVIRAGGALGGYRWGLARKRALLDAEAAVSAAAPASADHAR